MKQTLVRLNPEVHKTLRVTAAEKGISLNEALTQAVKMWLKKQGKHVK